MHLSNIKIIITILLFCTCANAISPQPPLCGNSSGTFTYNGSPVAISAAADLPITSQIAVSGLPSFLWDLDVTTFITHLNSSDLDITLTSPQGTVVTLTTDNGASNDNTFNGTTWDDQANPGGQVPYTSNNGLANDTSYPANSPFPSLVPEEPFGAFFGENPNGVWTLTINDDSPSANSQGNLEDWSLDIVSLTQAPETSTADVSNPTDFPITETGTPLVSSNINYNVGVSSPICGVEVITEVDHTFPGDIDMTLRSPSGRVVTLTTDNGGTNDNVFSNVRWNNDANTLGQVPYVNTAGIVTDHLYSLGVPVSSLTPEESLTAFAGDPSNGSWTLTISDDANQDGGLLDIWTLRISKCLPESDSDGDTFGNSCDLCPADAAKQAPGQCGCGVTDADQDSDGTANCVDGCIADASKTTPGKCGCGVAETDSDSDGTPNCIDQCASNPAKTSAGVCGCGVADSDTNANGVIDCKVNDELKARLKALSALAKGFKIPSGNANKVKAQTAKNKILKTQMKSLLKDIKNFSSQSQGSISVSGKITLGKQVSAVSSAGTKMFKLTSSTFSADKKAFNKSISSLVKNIL